MNARELSRELGRLPRARPAAGRAAHARAGEGEGLGVALPHRPLDAEPGDDRAAAARTSQTTRSRCSTWRDYVPAGMGGNVNIVPPAIDPLTPKNMALSPEDASFVCEQFGIDVDRPLHLPGLALRSVEGPARRDRRLPRSSRSSCPTCSSRSSARWPATTRRAGTSSTRRIAHADGDPDIHILNNFNNVGAIEVNAFQSHADVRDQKSTREGFGLTVSEAIWKARPFIGGDVGGIPLQVEDGVTGFLVSTVEECAERSLEMLKDPALGKYARAARQGARARRTSSRRATCATTCGSSAELLTRS